MSPPPDELGAPLPTEERDPVLDQVRAILRDTRDTLDQAERFRELKEQGAATQRVMEALLDAVNASRAAAERQAIAAELGAEEARKSRHEAHESRLEAARVAEAARAEDWARTQGSLKTLGKLLAWVLPITAAAAAGARQALLLFTDGPTP